MRASTLEDSGRAATSVQAAQSEGEPLAMSGYIEKRGGSTNPAYKSRFLTLTRYGNVRYFKDEHSTAKLGDFKITQSSEFEAFGTKEMRVTTPERVWEFRFINVEKRAEWYLEFQHVVNQLYLWVDDDNTNTASVLSNLRTQYEELAKHNAISADARDKVAMTESRNRGRASMTNRNSITGHVLAKVRNGENNNNITLQKLLEVQTSVVPRMSGERQPMDILCLTWNLAEYLPDLKELDFLADLVAVEPGDLPGLVVVSVQECQPVLYNITESKLDDLAPAELWRTMVQSVLGRHFSIVGNRTMGAVQITVFCRTNLVHTISHMSVGHVSCGLGNFVQNKGGVGVSFRMHETSFAFVGAHLPAHQNKVPERNDAYHRIDQLLTPLLLNGDTDESNHEVTNWYPSTQSLLCSNFDHVFFMGDFNYRVDCRDQERLMTMLAFMDTFERRLRGARPAEVPVAGVAPQSPVKAKASRRLTALSLTTLIESKRKRADREAAAEEEEEDTGEAVSWAMDTEEDDLFKRMDMYKKLYADTDAALRQKVTAADKKLYDDLLAKLLSQDQLTIQRKNHVVFNDYEEPPIDFRPSYKFAPDTEIYSCATTEGRSKNRTPAWCDRIMYKKQLNLSLSGNTDTDTAGGSGSGSGSSDSTGSGSSKPHVTVKSYDCKHGKFHSDHRAVVGVFTVHV